MCIARYVKCEYGYDPKDPCKQTCLDKPVNTGSKYTKDQCTTVCKNYMTTQEKFSQEVYESCRKRCEVYGMVPELDKQVVCSRVMVKCQYGYDPLDKCRQTCLASKEELSKDCEKTCTSNMSRMKFSDTTAEKNYWAKCVDTCKADSAPDVVPITCPRTLVSVKCQYGFDPSDKCK